MAGQPKKFTEESIVGYWLEFCISLFDEKNRMTPTFTSFIVWMKKEKLINVDMKTIYTTINRYFPSTKKDIESIRADTLVHGALMGRYASTPTIFALKNWCGWKDKNEDLGREIEDMTAVNGEVFGHN